MTAIVQSICCFEIYSTIWQKLKITCFRVYSFLEYGIHLFGNLALQGFYEYMKYNTEAYYDIGRIISVRNVHMSLYFMKTLTMPFKTGYQCLSSIL